MAKVKGRKQRKSSKDRVAFMMRLCPQQHQKLKQLAEHREETIALIVEQYIDHMLQGEVAQLDRQREQQNMAITVPDFEAEVYQEAYGEVESLVGRSWIKMSDKRRRALTFLALFPYEAGHRLARMIGMTRQGFQKIKESIQGLKVINHFADRSLWSQRPELLRSVIAKAIESDEPAWTELALRIFGDYGAKVAKEVKVEQQQSRAKPQDLDQQLIQQATLVNMTPKRFQLLWQQNKKRA